MIICLDFLVDVGKWLIWNEVPSILCMFGEEWVEGWHNDSKWYQSNIGHSKNYLIELKNIIIYYLIIKIYYIYSLIK